MKIIKKYVGINLYFFLLISAFSLSFLTYKLLELKAKSNINTNIQEDLLLRGDLQNWSTPLEEKLYKYIKNGEGKLFYISDEKDLEKFRGKEYCYKKTLIIQNGKNFQEVDVSTIPHFSGIYVRPVDNVYLSHCYFPFKVFDYITIKLK